MRKYLILAIFLCFPLSGKTRFRTGRKKRFPVKKLRLRRHNKYPPPKELAVEKPLTQKDSQDKHAKVLTKSEIIDLANNTIETIKQQPSIDNACALLKEEPSFILPSIQFILMDTKGMVWFLTQRPHRLWTLFTGKKIFSQEPLLTDILDGGTSGTWVPFFWWEDDLTQGYFKQFSFQDNEFILGIIHFVESNEYQRTELAFRVHRFYQEYGMKKTINTLNSPAGPFVYGRSGISIYNSDGLCLADSYDQTRVGLNISSLRDEEGNLIFDKIVNTPLTAGRSFGWTYIKKNGLERKMIVHQVISQEDQKTYYQVSGYYPQITKEFVVSLVNKVHTLFDKEGTKALKVLNTPNNRYTRGNLAIVVYSPDGIIRAHSLYPSLVGVNALKHSGQQGNVVAKDIIDQTIKHGESWTYHYILNAAEKVYAQKIVTPEGILIISAHGFIPQTKEHASKVRTDLVCHLLSVNALEYVLTQLNYGATPVTAVLSPVAYGGLFIELYDEHGFCIAAGQQPHHLWKIANPAILNSAKEMKKKKKTKEWMSFAEGSITKHVTVALCRKNKKEYIIVSGYQIGSSLKHNSKQKEQE